VKKSDWSWSPDGLLAGDHGMFQNWHLLGGKKKPSHAHGTGSWFLLGVLFKISD